MAAGRRIPSATYRLQFNRSFTFRDAHALVPYLSDLGISDCYASPLLKARAESSHGYDICDHAQLNPAIGSAEEFEAFSAALRAHGMGLVLDTVPNHMGIGDAGNLWWLDVLENGPGSVYASYFDIDWQPVKRELTARVLLPILEDQYGKVLESGKLRLVYEEGAFWISYYQTRLPVAPRAYSSILGYRLDALVAALGSEHEHVQELQSILTAISYLPPRTEQDPERIAERNREKEVIKRRIAALCQASPEVRAAIAETVQVFNGTPGDPRSFDLLDALLDAQAYRLAFWRVATEEINYRRFFDVNDLAAIRVEQPEVFQATHQLIFRLLTEGKVTGLRIDHPDGLWNPAAYLRQLQESYLRHQVQARLASQGVPEPSGDAVAAWCAEHLGHNGAAPWPLYVVAEKILCKGEMLPEDWAVYGTTGYEFANAVNGLFVDGSNRRAFDTIYRRFTGAHLDLRNLVNSTKKMIMLVSLASEINMLAHQINSISEKNRWYRDFTLNSLTFALREVIACLPVYRTYLDGSPDSVTRRDQAYIEAAVAEAKKRNPRTAESIFDFLRDTLLLRNVEDFREEDREALSNFVMKLQQVTGPVMAKAVEDTAFYVYNRLVSLNEVGGEPDQFGVSVAAFHRQNAERRRRWPHSLLATSTHDTKRSEDVRARINVLAELPREWRAALTRWSRMNRRKKTRVDGQAAPDRNDEYLFYQTLVGAWPQEPVGPEELARFRERMVAYMLKATREAKVHTSWVNPNEEYDAAVRDFVLGVLGEGGEDPFLHDLRAFQGRVAYYGQCNALAQVLLKLTAPGVPDLYQGTELWDFSLVDPDNRRPVDYAHRCTLLADLKAQVDAAGDDLTALAHDLLATGQDGRIKLYLTYRTLAFRRAHDQLFASGAYLPLEAGGTKRDHVVAFARTLGDQAALVVAPRLVVRLTGGVEQPPQGESVWKDTWLALPHEQVGRRYRNCLTGEVLAVGEYDGAPGLPLAALCGHFPVALLERQAE
ncbi:MAG: malto-oligosyltrehalose synthase [Chloroflexi bacterium]|nr:malto-oligosyltrehalose synthase [Chloroflexota bacterium]